MSDGVRGCVCVCVCIALETSNHWSTSIGRSFSDGRYYSEMFASHWTSKFRYVCQYHSKSLYGVSLSVSRLSVYVSTQGAINNRQKLRFLCPANFNPCSLSA